MNDNVEIIRSDLWATIIWQYYISDKIINFSQVITDVYNIKQNQQSKIQSNYGGWQSDFIKSENTELSKLMDYIKNNIYKCYDDLKIRKNFYNANMSYWININSFGHSNSKHIHVNSLLSGCIYLKVPKNSGNLLLHSNSINEYFFKSYTDCSSDNTSPEIMFFAEEKKVIIFPSFLPHSVEKNNSVEDRISVAFNFFYE